MTGIEVAKLMKIIQSAYRNVKFEAATIDVYSLMLADLPFDLAKKAVCKAIAGCTFPPTVAEIRRAAVEIGCPQPHTEEAVAEARAALRAYSPYYHSSRPWSNRAVGLAVHAMGGLATMGQAPDADRMWHNFRKVYENIREGEYKRLQTELGALDQAMTPFLPEPEEVAK